MEGMQSLRNKCRIISDCVSSCLGSAPSLKQPRRVGGSKINPNPSHDSSTDAERPDQGGYVIEWVAAE